MTLAWRYLRGRGLRTLLTTLAVVLGVMLIFGLNGLIPAILQAFNRSVLSTAGKIDVTVTSQYNGTFSPDLVDRVGRVPGVEVATPEMQRIVPLPSREDVPAVDQVAQLTVIGVEPGTAPDVRDFPITQGRGLEDGDGDVVVLSSDLAAKLRVGVGDELTLPSSVGTTRYTVVGLLSTATLPGQEQLFVPLGAAQRLFAVGARINTVEAAFEDTVDRKAVEGAIAKAIGKDYRVGGLSSNSTLLASLGIARYAFSMFGVFALATGGFIILNSFRTVVAERRRDVGMLRAIGAKRGTIIGMFLIESVLQGILGTGIGIMAGWGMAAGMIALMNPLYEQMLHFRLSGPVFEPWTWVLAISLGVGVTILAALLPAFAAGRVSPMDVMRPQLGEVYERRIGRRAWFGVALIAGALFGLATRMPGLVGLGSVLFLVGLTLVAPAIVDPLSNLFGEVIELLFAREGAIARSNLQRNPGRSAITVTAVMLGLAAVLAMAGVVSSIFSGFTSYLDKSLSADYMFIPQSIVLSQGNIAAGPRLAEEVRHAPGMGPVATLRMAQGRIGETDVQVMGIDPQEYPVVASFEWATGSDDAAVERLTRDRWLIANGIYAAQQGVDVGGRLVIDTPSGPRSYRVAGVGSDYLNAKLATVYVSQDDLARDFNVSTDLLIMGNSRPGVDETALRRRLDSVVADYPAFRLYESAEWREEQLASFDRSMVMMNVLMAALGLPSLLALVNTLAISVLARTREIGMLRAVGSTRRQIRRMVMAESLLLSAIGTALGIIAGVWLGYALVGAMDSAGFPMPYHFPWAGILLTIAVGLGFGVLAALIPARSAARLDVVEALHFE